MTSHCVWNRTQRVFRLLDRGVDWKSWRVVFSGVSDLAASEIRGVVGEGHRVLVLPNGIDSREWRVEHVERDPGTVTLVSVMRFAPRKRPLPLLRMLAQVRTRAPRGVDVRLVLVGEGGQEKQIRNAIDRLGLRGAVDLPGPARPRGHPAALRRRGRVRRPGQPRVVRPGGPRGPLCRPPRGGQGPDRHPGVRRARPGGPAGGR